MLNYKLSDNAKFNAIWSLLNVNFTEAGGWLIEYDICEIYDEYAVVKNYVEGVFERVYYTKNDETDSVELGVHVRCYIMDVSEEEKSALDALHGLNNGTYEKVDENYSNLLLEVDGKTQELTTLQETYNTEKSDFEIKTGELNQTIATLTTERDEAQASFAQAQATVTSLTEEVAALNSFKTEIEKKEKEAIVAKYTKMLDPELLASYTTRFAEYDSAKALDKDLAYELVSTNQSVFSQNPAPQLAYVPKDQPVGGIERLLDKYKK